MPYSNFNLKKVKDELHIGIVENPGLFDPIGEVQISELLKTLLDEQVPLAVSINTEKARSEFIISNVLAEIRRRFSNKISLFSGIEFNVDKEKDLSGFCDFIISRSSEQLMLNSPVIVIVEAKNENIIGGLGQCIAEMIAASIFNQQENNPVETIYGAVTSGTTWQFLRLRGNEAHIDLKEYFIDNPGKIVGILSSMVEQIA
ncbi:MAG: hypothetical protein KDJ31_16865 [Candidatus Competibacteraceae bacterium]|nr:hypothetical protein [Candidatus Competibacteraceae bacterium]HRY15685.1 hypothetical protein [Candidatus Competibacteraceae bacterium]